MQLGEYDRALEFAQSAVAENPNDDVALSHAGVVYLFAGDLKAAAELQLGALALSPNEFGAHGQITCVSHIRMAEAQFDEALNLAKRSLAVSPHYGPTYWMLIAGNAHLGRLHEAKEHLAELNGIVPGVSVSRLRLALHARDPRRVDILFDGMRLAGMPED